MQPKTPLFTSDSQHPPRFRHAVYLGEEVKNRLNEFMYLSISYKWSDHALYRRCNMLIKGSVNKVLNEII